MLFIPLIKRVFETKTIEKLEDDVEFKVIRTNWCWKHQERIIRFSKEKFYRFNDDICREEFEYENVKDVFVKDHSIVIHFKSNISSQFIECEKVDEFIKELSNRCNSIEIITIEKEE